jgi:membrane-associated phospholipid phosphatase
MCCVALLGPVAPVAAAIGGVLAVLVGLSRIPLGQHTLPQVGAGWALGFGLTSLFLLLAT